MATTGSLSTTSSTGRLDKTPELSTEHFQVVRIQLKPQAFDELDFKFSTSTSAVGILSVEKLLKACTQCMPLGSLISNDGKILTVIYAQSTSREMLTSLRFNLNQRLEDTARTDSTKWRWDPLLKIITDHKGVPHLGHPSLKTDENTNQPQKQAALA